MPDNPLNMILLVKPESIKTLRDIAVESIREAIVAGHFRPGHHLKERELSLIMGISTTPIKEALRILGQEGLVETFPRKGTYVSEFVDSTIEETLMLRASLEGLCARLAAVKITEEKLKELDDQILLMEKLFKENKAEALVEENTKFHVRIRQAANNPMIYKIVMNISAFDTAFRKRALRSNEEARDGLREHRLMFEAIRARDPDLAESRMKEHIMRTAHSVLKNRT